MKKIIIKLKKKQLPLKKKTLLLRKKYFKKPLSSRITKNRLKFFLFSYLKKQTVFLLIKKLKYILPIPYIQAIIQDNNQSDRITSKKTFVNIYKKTPFLTWKSCLSTVRLMQLAKKFQFTEKPERDHDLNEYFSVKYSDKYPHLKLWRYIMRSVYRFTKKKRKIHTNIFKLLKKKLSKKVYKTNKLYIQKIKVANKPSVKNINTKRHVSLSIVIKKNRRKTLKNSRIKKNLRTKPILDTLTITIKRTVNNLFITAFNKQTVIANFSSGKAGFSGPKKLGFYTAQQVAKKLAKAVHAFCRKRKIIISNKKRPQLLLILKSPISDFMVKASVRSLLKAKCQFKKIVHLNFDAHNGSQVKKKKRK